MRSICRALRFIDDFDLLGNNIVIMIKFLSVIFFDLETCLITRYYNNKHQDEDALQHKCFELILVCHAFDTF